MLKPHKRPDFNRGTKACTDEEVTRVKILHFSDTHLGYSEYSALDPAGINQRESDVYQAFVQAIDKSIELKPVVAIHSGDLFDNVRPANRAINMAMTQFRRLSEAGIAVVVIAGNHSAPKIRTTGSIFQSLAQLRGVFPIYDGEYKLIRIGEIAVHGISDSPTVEELEQNLRRAEPILPP